MSEIGARDFSRCPLGLYRIDAEQRERIVRRASLARERSLVVLAGREIRERETFFAALARELHFPDYFGHNWDAVYDCLTDPGLFPLGGVVLVLEDFADFAAREPEQWEIALNVFRAVGAFWQPLDRSFYALLYGRSGEAAGIEALPEHCLTVEREEA